MDIDNLLRRAGEQWRARHCSPAAMPDFERSSKRPGRAGTARRRMIPLFAAAVVLIVAAVTVLPQILRTAPADTQTPTSHGSGPAELPQLATPYWPNPIHGVAVASISEAQRQVPFKITRIPTLPEPYRVLLNPGRPAHARVVVLQYRTSYGLVDEYEYLPEISMRGFRAFIKHWVALNGKKSTEGTMTDVRLTGGYHAALTTAANNRTSDIQWIEPGVEYMIIGPSLTRRDCVTLANLQASAVRN